VAGFLTDAWIDDMAGAAATAELPVALDLVVQQVVVDDGTEVAYVLEVRDGSLTVRRGRADDPDVTFTQDRATAAAIARGELSAQGAFLDGRLALHGDLQRVLPDLTALAAVDDLFAAARASTEW
jgi:alkyl sulfatase BDS1-like metallo-beta-lactamase superfamily hydrolase